MAVPKETYIRWKAILEVKLAEAEKREKQEEAS